MSGRSDAWRKVRATTFGGLRRRRLDTREVELGRHRCPGACRVPRRGTRLLRSRRFRLGRGEPPRGKVQARAELDAGEALSPDPTHRWVEPVLVCEVEFREYSAEGHLRHPIFVRFRDDKAPEECLSTYDEPVEVDFDPEPVREVIVTNRDKIFFPEQGLTKGDLIDYYENVAPLDAALSRRPAAGTHPVSRRHPRQVVLPTRRARLRSRLAHPQDPVERERRTRGQLLRRAERRVAPVPGQHGRDSHPRVAQPHHRPGTPGLVRAWISTPRTRRSPTWWTSRGSSRNSSAKSTCRVS